MTENINKTENSEKGKKNSKTAENEVSNNEVTGNEVPGTYAEDIIIPDGSGNNEDDFRHNENADNVENTA